MWSQACDQVERADRLHRQFFRLGQVGQAPAWEPPVDVFESESEIVIRAAVPDVDPADFEFSLRETGVLLSGRRRLSAEAARGVIRQLEIPYGRLERHIPLPPGRYRLIADRYHNGCFELRLERSGIHD
jgi:HSP20 family molecular chaperone IbpA